MEIKPKLSLFGQTETFKVDNVLIKAEAGTAFVEKTSDGTINVTGGNNVRVVSGNLNDVNIRKENPDKTGVKISFFDSEISSCISTLGKAKIFFDNCTFCESGDKKTFFGLLKSKEKSGIVIGGENNSVTINGDLKGSFSCYSMGDNDEKRKDNITIIGNNYATIVSGLHDEITVAKKDFNESSRLKLDDIDVKRQLDNIKRNNDLMMLSAAIMLQQQTDQQMFQQQMINNQLLGQTMINTTGMSMGF